MAKKGNWDSKYWVPSLFGEHHFDKDETPWTIWLEKTVVVSDRVEIPEISIIANTELRETLSVNGIPFETLCDELEILINNTWRTDKFRIVKTDIALIYNPDIGEDPQTTWYNAELEYIPTGKKFCLEDFFKNGKPSRSLKLQEIIIKENRV